MAIESRARTDAEREGSPRPASSAAARALPILLVLAGALAYSGSFSVPFLFDDEPQIVANPILRDLRNVLDPERAASLGASSSQLGGLRGRPVAYLTFALNYRLGGLDVAGWHAVNLLVHLAAGLLLFRLLALTLALPLFDRSALRGRERLVAFFAAALFLVHPVQTQAVTYVVQRMTSLAAMLCLLSLVAWVEARLRRPGAARAAFWLLSLAALLAAMKTKENAATFPLLVLLYDLLFLDGPVRTRIVSLLPHLATMAVVPFRFLAGSASAGAALDAATSLRAGTPLPRADYFLTQLRVVTGYVRLLAWPSGQTIDHDVRVSRSASEPAVLLSFAFLAALGALAALLARRSRRGEPGLALCGFGIGWFFVALSVESTFIPIQDLMVEHRLYLPSAGLLAAAVAGAFLLVPPAAERRLAAALGLACVALGLATFARNRVWKDAATLWTDAAAKAPKAYRPRYNLGTALLLAGRDADAQRELLAAAELEPDFSGTWTNLASLALRRGDLGNALAWSDRALSADPSSVEAAFNKAEAHFRRKEYAEVAATLRQAVASDRTGRARLRQQLLLGEIRGLVGAVPGGPSGAHLRMSGILRAGGLFDEALAEARAAIEASPSSAEALGAAANLLRDRGSADEAIALYRRALAARPGDRRLHNDLGIALRSIGKLAEAVDEYRRALAIDPAYAEARNNLGNALRGLGRPDLAVPELEEALRLLPGNGVVRRNLEEARQEAAERGRTP